MLLDELGRATDPEEGGALGIAVLEHFRAAGAFTLASTHLLALKIYGAGTAGVVNGSMGFDEQTLEPTYVLQTGAPGKSAGLEIARRLGMPERLIEKARAAAGQPGAGHRAVPLGTAPAAGGGRAAGERAARAEGRAGRSREAALAKQWAERESAKLKELDRRCDLVLEKFDVQAKETIEQNRRGRRRRKNAAAQALRQVGRLKRELREEMETTVLSTRGRIAAGRFARSKIAEGVRVRIKGVREPARVRRKLGRGSDRGGGGVHEAAGLRRRRSGGPARRARARRCRNMCRSTRLRWRAPRIQELNVIGQRAEEACAQVEKFLDNAMLADVVAGQNRARVRDGGPAPRHRGAALEARRRREVLPRRTARRRRRAPPSWT